MKKYLFIILVLAFASCKKEEILQSIELNQTDLDLFINNSYKFTVSAVPNSLPVPPLIWTSLNSEVLTVNNNGEVFGKSLGATSIIVATKDYSLQSKCYIKVLPIQATNITLSKNSMELIIGEEETLTYSIFPANTTDKNVEWISLDQNVASVDNSGKVKALAEGNTRIIVKTGDNISDSCSLLVKLIPVTNLLLSESEISLEINETSLLDISIEPENATFKNVLWSSSNDEIASVNNGIVTGLSIGTAIITAKSESSNHEDSCRVTVNPISVKSITLDHTEISLMPTEKATLIASITPNDAANKNVFWTSSNIDIVQVTNDGLVTAINFGEAIISAISEDGNQTASCKVNVVDIDKLVSLITHPSRVISTSAFTVYELLSKFKNPTNHLLYVYSFLLVDDNSILLQIKYPEGSNYLLNGTLRTNFDSISFDKNGNASAAILKKYRVIVQFRFNGSNYEVSEYINTSIVSSN